MSRFARAAFAVAFLASRAAYGADRPMHRALRYDMGTQDYGEARGNVGPHSRAHNPTWSPHQKGRYLVMELEGPQIQFLEQFLAAHQNGKAAAANEQVSVVGVGVHSSQEFEAMSDQALLGAPPSMGASEAAR